MVNGAEIGRTILAIPMSSIPAQHAEWVVKHSNPLIPFKPPIPVAGIELYSFPTNEKEEAVDFSLLPISSEERAQLIQKRSALAKSPIPAILEYLKLLPASTGQGLLFPWKHHLDNTSAEMERAYLTYNLGCLYLLQSAKTQGIKEALASFKSANKIPVDTESSYVMESLCWLLLTHDCIEQQFLELHQKVNDFNQNLVLANRFQGMSQLWLSYICSPATQQRWRSIAGASSSSSWKDPKLVPIDYFGQAMYLSCQAMAEYYAVRSVLLDPSTGVKTFYPTFTKRDSEYRGILLSRLNGHLGLLVTNIQMPDIMDTMLTITKGSGNLIVQLHQHVFSNVVPHLRTLRDKIKSYNDLTSHNPIPEFKLETFSCTPMPLPGPKREEYPALEYPIRPPVLVSGNPILAQPNFLDRIKTTLTSITKGGNESQMDVLIQSELGNLEMVSGMSDRWLTIKIQLTDMIRYRQKNETKLPALLLSELQSRERFILYQLTKLQSMPKSSLDLIELTITQEMLPFYESL